MKNSVFLCLFLFLIGLLTSAAAQVNPIPNIYTDEQSGNQFLFLPSFVNDISVAEAVTVLHSQNLPAIFIETSTQTMTAVHEDKSFHQEAHVTLYGCDGEVLIDKPLTYIKGHGNATWQYEKKSYQIKFEEKTDVMGMGAARKWLLMANAQDGSYMRNYIVYQAVKALGVPYAIDCLFVDLYLNGDYAGNYLLTEKVELASNRIDINRDVAKKAYLIEIENNMDEQDILFETDWGTLVRVHDPDPISDEQLAFIQEKVISLENTLGDCGDFLPLVDVTSIAQRAVIDEITKNNDSFEGSTFFYLTQQNNWLFNGGVYWDYDSTLGNWSYRYGYYRNPQGLTLPDQSMWYETMYADDTFFQALQEQYSRIRPLFEQLDLAQIANHIAASVQMDYIRYQGKSYFMQGKAFKEQVSALDSFLEQRLAFLDKAITQKEPFIWVFLNTYDERSQYVWLSPNTPLSSLPKVEGVHAWAYDETAPVLAEDTLLTASCMLVPK